MRSESGAFADATGDIMRVTHDERGTWVEIEERVGGEVVQTAAVGPLDAGAGREVAGLVSPRTPWRDRLAAVALLLPPILGLGGLDDWLRAWGAVALCVCILLVLAGRR